MAKHFICPNCGPAGFEVELAQDAGNLVKKCNCCGFEKRFNKRAKRSQPSQEFLNWLAEQSN